MDAVGQGCGDVYQLYALARDGDVEAVRTHWEAVEPTIDHHNEGKADRIDAAVTAGELDAVRSATAELLFVETEEPALDGPIATVLGTALYWFGYVAAFVLFARAHSREAVVDRLRWAYRTVGVTIRDIEPGDGVDRTVFRCPYRNLGAGRYGRRRVCHDILDRVDDGYVAFLARHRGLDYDRPRACAASECCYSVVSEP